MPDNLTYDKIIADIESGNISNLYLFYGPEKLLINDVLSRMEKKLINPGFKSINYVKIDGAAVNMDVMINACETLPFMDEKKIVVIDDANFFKGKKSKEGEGSVDEPGLDGLCDYLKGVPGFTTLVFIAGSEVDKRKKIYSCIKKFGSIGEFGALKIWELEKWIIGEFGKEGKRINRADAIYLAERSPGSLENMSREIVKLSSYVGNKNTISRADIDAVIPKSLEMNIFQLVDSLSAKNPGRALVIFNELLMESQPVPLILSMIIRQYRLLLSTKLFLAKGYSNSDIGSKLSIRPFVVSPLVKLSANYREEDIEKRLRYCLETDKAIKTGKLDQRIAIESLIVEFSN